MKCYVTLLFAGKYTSPVTFFLSLLYLPLSVFRFCFSFCYVHDYESGLLSSKVCTCVYSCTVKISINNKKNEWHPQAQVADTCFIALRTCYKRTKTSSEKMCQAFWSFFGAFAIRRGAHSREWAALLATSGNTRLTHKKMQARMRVPTTLRCD